MRRISASIALVLAFALLVSTAGAKVVATFSIAPNKAGKGTHATLDVSSRPKQNPRVIVLRVVRGVKFDPKAVAVLCDKAHADANNCPVGSHIGGGTAYATVTSDTNAYPPFSTTLKIDLFLAPPVKSGDKSGVVAHFKEKYTKAEAHTTGRVKQIPTGTFGYENRFVGLDKVLKPPSGYSAHVDYLHVVFGTERVKNGVRHDLIRNPSTCTGSWPYQLRIGYPDNTLDPYDGSVACSS